jgi:hypothetical protein
MRDQYMSGWIEVGKIRDLKLRKLLTRYGDKIAYVNYNEWSVNIEWKRKVNVDALDRELEWMSFRVARHCVGGDWYRTVKFDDERVFDLSKEKARRGERRA